MKLYQAIARELDRVQRAKAENKPQWQENAEEELEKLFSMLPSGSGFDSGVKLSEDSTPEKLIFICDFHHMDENGFYSGWSYHKAILTASLVWDFNLRITGRDRNGIKEYIGDTLHDVMRQDVDTF